VYRSIFSIAQQHQIESKEVIRIRIIYLAFLAPGIVERIASGVQPAGLGVRRLLAMAPLPLDWAEQRRLLGVV
jgi:site-specific DNA recombinase